MSTNNGSNGSNGSNVYGPDSRERADKAAQIPMTSGNLPTNHAVRTREPGRAATAVAYAILERMAAVKASTPKDIEDAITAACKTVLAETPIRDKTGRYVLGYAVACNPATAATCVFRHLGVQLGAPDAVETDPRDALASQMGITRAALDALLAGVPAGTITPAAPAETTPASKPGKGGKPVGTGS